MKKLLISGRSSWFFNFPNKRKGMTIVKLTIIIISKYTVTIYFTGYAVNVLNTAVGDKGGIRGAAPIKLTFEKLECLLEIEKKEKI